MNAFSVKIDRRGCPTFAKMVVSQIDEFILKPLRREMFSRQLSIGLCGKDDEGKFGLSGKDDKS